MMVKCPDCEQCQLCSESRCRLCRGGQCRRAAGELGPSFTYGDYMAWKHKKTPESTKKPGDLNVSEGSLNGCRY